MTLKLFSNLENPPHEHDLIIYVSDGDYSEDYEACQVFRKNCPKTRVLVIGKNNNRYNVGTFLLENNIRSLVATTANTLVHAKMLFRLLEMRTDYGSSDDERLSLNLTKIFKDEKVKVHVNMITDYAKKTEFLDKISETITAAVRKAQNADKCILVMDEMLINASYHADPEHETREESERKPVEIHYAYVAPYFVFKVRDNFGTLEIDRILDHLDYHVKKGREKIQKAGLGSFLAFKNCDNVIYNIRQGHFTEVMGLMNLVGVPAKEKSISIFYKKELV